MSGLKSEPLVPSKKEFVYHIRNKRADYLQRIY